MWNVNTELIMLSELSVLGFVRRDRERILLNGGLYTWQDWRNIFWNILDLNHQSR